MSDQNFKSEEEQGSSFLDEANKPNRDRDPLYVSADKDELITAAKHLGVSPAQVLAVKEKLGGEYKREAVYDFFKEYDVLISFQPKQGEGCDTCSS